MLRFAVLFRWSDVVSGRICPPWLVLCVIFVAVLASLTSKLTLACSFVCLLYYNRCFSLPYSCPIASHVFFRLVFRLVLLWRQYLRQSDILYYHRRAGRTREQLTSYRLGLHPEPMFASLFFPCLLFFSSWFVFVFTLCSDCCDDRRGA